MFITVDQVHTMMLRHVCADGLSFSTFNYSKAVIPKTVPSNSTLDVSVTVTNAGKMDGEEVAQLYIRDVVSTVTTPILVCCQLPQYQHKGEH